MTASDFGYGYRIPQDFQSEYGTLAFVVKQIVGAISSATIVKVISCTNSGGVSPFGFVDAQPLVNQLDGLGNSVPHALLYHLPYFRLQGGANAIICDPEPGDLGIAIIADRDVSTVKNTQAQANPGSRRRFDMSDGIYVGGILNKVPTQFVEFITGTGITVKDINGNVVDMRSAGVKITDANGNIVNMHPAGVDVTAPQLTCTGAIIAGFGGGDQVGVQTHVHDGVAAGAADTTPPLPGT